MTKVFKTSSQKKDQFRLGILVDGRHVPLWVKQIVEDIQNSEYANLAMVLLKQVDDNEQTPIPTKSCLLYRLYRKLDHFTFQPSVDSFETVTLDDEILANCSVIETSTNSDAVHGEFCENDLSKIEQFNLDLLLHLSDDTIELNGSKLARYGVVKPRPWPSNRYFDSARKVLENSRVTQSVLFISDSDSVTPRILAKCFFKTDRWSARRQENVLAWKAVSLVKNSIRQISQLGDISEPSTPSKDEDNSAIDSAFQDTASCWFERTPGNVSMLKFGLALGWRGFLHKLFYDKGQWALCYHIGSERFRLPKSDDLANYTPIVAPKDKFYGDPFCVQRNGRYFIFIEEWTEREGKGVISLIEIGPDGRYEKPVVVLQRDYHLSYPCVFSYQGEDYMIPETKKNKTIELYKCTSWPRDWKLEKVLFHNLAALDPTIEKIDDRYWLFVGVEPEKGAINCDQLNLYFADSPFGPWKPHPKNPVVSDVRRARPAGRLFRKGGRIFRPAQDCSQRYGYAISINEIEKISPCEYKENLVNQILPWSKDIQGVHTLNMSGKLTIVDFNKSRRKWF